MNTRNILAVLLLLVAGLQTAWAQKVTLYKTSGQTIECNVAELDSIVFSEAEPVLVTSIELSETSITLQPDESKTLTWTVLPEDSDNKTVTWASSDEAVATVAEGLVTAVADGTCTITCFATDGSGVYAECQVTVFVDRSGTIDGRDYVDLGLPSGTLWATCNVGANSPEEYGDYFAWGETKPKVVYDDWSIYKYCEDSSNALTKYCYQSDYGYNGFTDYLTELMPEDDAATANWGSGWQMPSLAQLQELCNSEYTTTTWTAQNGKNGILIKSKSNGNSIFLPAASYRLGSSIDPSGGGPYWSRSLDTSDSRKAFYFNISNIGCWAMARNYGLPVRPIRKQEPKEEHEWVDLGLPSGTLWATCNVGANSPEEYGDYFAWGETTPKDEYNWSTYKYCEGSYNTLTRYCYDSSYGYNGFTDSLGLLPEDDAATANWGAGWQMPSFAQLQELYHNSYTTTTWTTQNGKNGRLIKSKSNGNSIFLPAAGCRSDTSLYNAGIYGWYWSSPFFASNSSTACSLLFDSGSIGWTGCDRYSGFPVRPVRVLE